MVTVATDSMMSDLKDLQKRVNGGPAHTESVSDATTLIMSPATPGRIVAICGFAPTSRELANGEAPNVEIWSLNRCYVFLKRWDRWYEVHQPELYEGKTGLREPDYVNMLRRSERPVYMQVPDPSIPNCVKFPTDEICRHFGLQFLVSPNAKFSYFSTSIAYMLAHAVYEHDLGEKIDEIRMYGVDMAAFSEYSYQRPCVEFWLGVVAGRGIKLTVPKQSPILKGPAYGNHEYHQQWEMAADRIQLHKKTVHQRGSDVQAAIGAINEMQSLRVALEKGAKIDDYWKARMQELQQWHANSLAELNSSIGAELESQHWLTAFSAPQTLNQEPTPFKMPQVLSPTVAA